MSQPVSLPEGTPPLTPHEPPISPRNLSQERAQQLLEIEADTDGGMPQDQNHVSMGIIAYNNLDGWYILYGIYSEVYNNHRQYVHGNFGDLSTYFGGSDTEQGVSIFPLKWGATELRIEFPNFS